MQREEDNSVRTKMTYRFEKTKLPLNLSRREHKDKTNLKCGWKEWGKNGVKRKNVDKSTRRQLNRPKRSINRYSALYKGFTPFIPYSLNPLFATSKPLIPLLRVWFLIGILLSQNALISIFKTIEDRESIALFDLVLLLDTDTTKKYEFGVGTRN